MRKKPVVEQQQQVKDKRILIVSDFHCGHRIGLTPPAWANHPDKFVDLRKRLWDFYAEQVDKYKPYDLVVLNGDAIDGKGERSGGTEAITADRFEQAEMALKCLEIADCKTVRMTYGTPYHGGVTEDMEKAVIDKMPKEAGWDARISSHLFLVINGKNLNFKHFISSSQIPHLRLTPIAREILQNRQWFLEGVQPRADLLARAHDHYDEVIYHDGCFGLVSPSLQGLGSKYGARRCSGTVTFGITVQEIASNGDMEWPRIIKLEGKYQSELPEVL